MIVLGDKYALEQIQGNTYCISTPFAKIPVYMLDEKNVIMIDSGYGKRDCHILEVLEENHLHVQAVLTSHFHPDHVGNHAALQEKYGAKLYMTPYAAVMCADNQNIASSFLGTSYGVLCASGRKTFNADILIRDEQEITVCGAVFKVLQLPGHAPEHIGFVTPDGVGYMGDAVLSDQVLQLIRMPYTTCCQLDIQSMKKITEMDLDLCILAHNGITNDIRTLAQQNIEKMYGVLDVIEGLADHYMSLEQLSVAAMNHYGIDQSSMRKIVGANHNVKAFADYLLDTGRLTCRAQDGFVQYIRKDLA